MVTATSLNMMSTATAYLEIFCTGRENLAYTLDDFNCPYKQNRQSSHPLNLSYFLPIDWNLYVTLFSFPQLNLGMTFQDYSQVVYINWSALSRT